MGSFDLLDFFLFAFRCFSVFSIFCSGFINMVYEFHKSMLQKSCNFYWIWNYKNCQKMTNTATFLFTSTSNFNWPSDVLVFDLSQRLTMSWTCYFFVGYTCWIWFIKFNHNVQFHYRQKIIIYWKCNCCFQKSHWRCSLEKNSP